MGIKHAQDVGEPMGVIRPAMVNVHGVAHTQDRGQQPSANYFTAQVITTVRVVGAVMPKAEETDYLGLLGVEREFAVGGQPLDRFLADDVVAFAVHGVANVME
jgi:hypothetical protein